MGLKVIEIRNRHVPLLLNLEEEYLQFTMIYILRFFFAGAITTAERMPGGLYEEGVYGRS